MSVAETPLGGLIMLPKRPVGADEVREGQAARPSLLN